MANISERPLDAATASSLQDCAGDALELLGLAGKSADPAAVVAAIDAFVHAWQNGKRPPKRTLDPEDAPFIIGSLWGEQLVKRFGWQWAMVTFHDHDDSVAPGVLSPDRSLALYPIHFLMGCFEDSGVDATIALSYNMLEGGSIGKLKPKAYFNLMEGVHRLVPRV